MKNLQKTILASSLLLAFGVSTANAADAPIRQLGEVTVDGEKVEISDIIGSYTIGSSESQTVTIANKGFTEYTDSKGEQVQTANRGIWVTGEDKSKVLGSEITISSENGRGIQADSKGTLSIGGDNTKSVTVNSNSIGIFVLTGAQVDIKTQTLTVNEKSESGFGIHVQNNTQTAQAPENSSYLKIEADNIVVNSTALGLSAFSNGQMDINGNIVVNAEHAIDTRGNATINVNTDGKHTTVLNGDIVFETPYTKEDPKGSGNLINSNINVGLHGEGSSWTGRAYQNFIGEDKTDVDTVDLDNGNATFGNVTGFKVALSNGGTWNMTGSSFVNNLAATKGAVINMQEEATTLNIDQMAVTDSTINMQGGTEQTVTINDLTVENGTVNMAASTKDGRSVQTGHLTAKSVAEGGSVAINYTGITSDDIVDPDSAFDSAQANVKLEGTKQIQTFAEGDVLGEMTRETSANGDAGAVQIVENTKLASMKGVNAAALVAWRDEVAYTNQRLEFLRDASHAYGTWAQVYGGESTYDDASVDLKSTTVQVGADATLGDWVVGGAFSYMKGDADMTNGSADTDAYTLALYTARQFDSGLYVNGMARYGRLSTDATAGNMTGSYDNNAFSVGGNVGYRFTFAQQAFVEPQFGLQYAYVTGDDYTATNGVKVKQDNFDALVASLGARIGFNFAEDAGKVFARASVNHDFLGEVDGTASNDKAIQNMYVDLGGTWVTYGVGTQFNFTDNLSVWGNVDRTTGGEVSTHYMMNAGLRYTF